MSLISGGNATMVPCVTNASASLSVAPTSGGSSGSVPANLVVSTLIAENSISVSYGVPNGASFNFNIEPPAGLNTPAEYSARWIANTNTLTASMQQSILDINSDANNNMIIISTEAGAQIALSNVSSINGAAPGGGGSIPANLVASTLQLAMNAVPSPAYSFGTGVDGGGNTYLAYGGPSTNVTYTTVATRDDAGAQQSYIQTLVGLNEGQIAYGTTGGYLSKVLLDKGGVSISSLRSDSITATGISTNQVASATTSALSLFSGNINTSMTLDNESGLVNITAAGELGTVNLGCTSITTSAICNMNISTINGAVPSKMVSKSQPITGIGAVTVTGSITQVGTPNGAAIQSVQITYPYSGTNSLGMLMNQLAPQWSWAGYPAVSIMSQSGSTGIASPYAIIANLSGDPGDLSQTLELSWLMSGGTNPTNIIINMVGQAYPPSV